MPISLRIWILYSVLILLTGAAVDVAAMVDTRARSATIEVEFENGLLTLEARDAPLSEVVLAIGERTGFETIVFGKIDAHVDMSLSELPLAMALEQVLGDTDRVIAYTPAEKDATRRGVVRLWLLGSGESARANPASEMQGAVADDLQRANAKRRSEAVLRLGTAPATEIELEALAQALQNDEVALVRSRAAVALGALADERAVSALEVALLDENPSVRIQAIHALSKIGGERAILALGDVLLHSTDTVQRVVAAHGLSAQDTAVARHYLDAVANDLDEEVRAASKTQSARVKSSVSENRSQVDRLGAEITK